MIIALVCGDRCAADLTCFSDFALANVSCGNQWVTDQVKAGAVWVTGRFGKKYVAAAQEAHRDLLDKFSPGAFRTALENSLARLPIFLVDTADEIFRKGISVLYLPIESFAKRPLTAVPRDLVLRRFQTYIMSAFAKSAHLEKFPGLAEKALSHAATEAENAFFDSQHNEKTTWSDQNIFVVGIDDSTIWQDETKNGHYYLAEYLVRDRMFDIKARQAVPTLADKIGRLSTKDRDSIVSQLY